VLTLLLAITLLGARYTTVSAPIYVAALDSAGAMIGVPEPLRVTLETSYVPLTVNCAALYQPLLPLGDCYLFGRIRGGYYSTDGKLASYFDVGDGYAKTVRVYPIEPISLEHGLFVRCRIFVEQQGRGDADEIVVMLGR
jgi:hypothetical protein